jgi:S-DNA-T family DNA segregation ATPase FtsK/SpoIIIE
MRIGLTLQVGERAVDVLVDAPGGVALGDLSERLCAMGGVRRGTPWWCAEVRLDPAATVGLPPLTHGAVLRAGESDAPVGPPVRGDAPIAHRQLRVVCGRDAGLVRPLPPGVVRLGRGAEAGLRLADPDVSRAHAELTVDQGVVTVRDLGSTNGTELDGHQVGPEPVRIRTGDMLRAGESVLTVADAMAGRACTRPDGDGHVVVNTPPRIGGPDRRVHVDFPAEPAAPHSVRFQPVALLVPLVVAVPAALWWGPTMLVFLVLSPVMMLANLMGDRASGRRTRRRDQAAYRVELEAAQARLAEALRAEARARREESPDPASVAVTAAAPGPRLWERPRDAAALTLRVGLADLPARTTVSATPGSPAASPIAIDVPVTVALRACGALGVAGPRERVLDVARAVLLQVAVAHSPRDVRVDVLCGVQAGTDWAWTRWLPHLGPRTGTHPGSDPVADRVAGLVDLLEARRARLRGPGADPCPSDPLLLLVLDDARELRRVPGVARLLAEGPPLGVHAICLTAEAGGLPAECGATALVHGETGTRLEVRITGAEVIPSALADLVGPDRAESVARSLAPLRDATPSGDGTALPERVRLLDLLDLPDPAGPTEELAGALSRLWSTTAPSMRAVVGVGPAGPVAVDLERDGPHGLVAGTTGAGKSELLQTLVASLAVANRPDELSFLLIDYKGGAAFAECAGLPHTAGTVTDLDPHLTARALRSMDAELRRRERRLGEAGCADLPAYEAAGRPHGPLGRLLIVVDEFASLATELPDFIGGLVDIARRGRSLGVHLLLATQRPAGVVTAEIRANTALRIALRVTDPEESRDVVDCADAAGIPARAPGRGYLRTANGSPTPFQTARVGGPAPGPRRTEATVTRWPWMQPEAAQGYRDAGLDDGRREVETAGPSDLAALVAAARRAAELVEAAPPPPPWLPALPELVRGPDLGAGPSAADAGSGLSFGLLDLPAAQAYASLTLDLAAGGHWTFVGGPRTGRSTALRTLAAEAGRRPVDEIHLYGLDFAGGGLRPVVALPHCGAVAGRDDVRRAARLIERLLTEVTRRQELLARAGLGSAAEQRATIGGLDPLPWMLLLVDGWEGLAAALTELDPATGTDSFLRLLQDGPAAGLHLAIAGGRDLLTGRVAALVAHRAVLALPDRLDYGLAGIPPREVPERMPPGRALIPTAQGVLEAQLAVPGTEADGAGQAAALAALAARARAAPFGSHRRADGPLRVAELPCSLPWAAAREAADRAGGHERPGGRLWTLVGLGGDDLRPLGIDPAQDGHLLLVAGPPRSGRSTALAAIARWHTERGVPVIAVAPRRSPLRASAGSPDGPDGAWITDGADPQALPGLIAAARRAGARGRPAPVAILVDDVEQVADTAACDLLAELLSATEQQAAGAGDLLVVVAGQGEAFTSAYRGLPALARKSRCALLLGRCGAAEGDLAGVPIPRTTAGPPGRGLLALRGDVSPIQVPLP